MKLKNLFSFFCKEPYRIFFPVGILMGVIGVIHWFFYAIGWTQSYSMIFHSSIQMQAYMTCFVIGFLLTAIPRFSGSHTASPLELGFFLLFLFGIVVFNSRLIFPGAQISFIALLFWLMRFVFVRFQNKTTKNLPPIEFIWIPIAIFHGVVGTLLMILASFFKIPAWIGIAGKLMSEQGFLLSIVLGVGGFLGPRLMGISQLIFSSKDAPQNQLRENRNFRKKTIFIHGIIFFASFLLEALNYKLLAYGFRAIIVTSELMWSGIIRHKPKVKDFYVTLLWISFWMVLIGNWGVFLFPGLRVAMLHFVFIGGYSLMTFAVSTMVILSHAGEVRRLHHRLFILWIIAIAIGAAVLTRFAAIFFPNAYFNILAVASLIWILGGISWFIYSIPFVLKVPQEDEFERIHREAEKRIKENQCGE